MLEKEVVAGGEALSFIALLRHPQASRRTSCPTI